jgi:hypothetical protein
MSTSEIIKRRRRGGHFWAVAVLLLLAVFLPRTAQAQPARGPASKLEQLPVEDLLRAPGKVLTEGHNSVPVGALKVKAYRLEEVKLPAPLELDLGHGRESVESVLRLSVSGESFLPGAYTIWIDSTPLDGVSYSPTELSVIVISPLVLEHGAALSVTYDSKPGHPAGTTLPEALEVPARLQRLRPPGTPWKVLSIRRVPSAPELHGQPGIQIAISGDRPFEIRDAMLIMRIGEHAFDLSSVPDGGRRTVVFTLTLQQFAELKNGDRVTLGYGSAERHGWGVGRLDKGQLEQYEAGRQ